MKKALLLVLAVLVVLCGMMAAAWLYLPTFAFRMLGRAIGGTVEASKARITYQDGLLVLRLDHVRMKGSRVEGTVGVCEIRLKPSKGVYIKYLTISDFHISLPKEGGHLGFYPVPVELAEIRKGTVDYGGKKYVLREMRVSNFNTGAAMEFEIDGGVEGLGNLKTKGQGIWGDKRSDIKGAYELSRVDMARVFKDYEGFADSQGTFTYRDEVFVMDGEVEAPYFSMMEEFLSKRLVSTGNVCRIHLTRAGETSDVTLKGLSFKETPLSLRFIAEKEKLVYLELRTGFLAIPDLREYIDFARFSEGDWGPLSLVKDGEVRISRFIFREQKPLRAELDLRDVDAGTGKVAFKGVGGSLRLEGDMLFLTRFEGRFRESRIFDVAGSVPLKLDRDVEIKGRFSLSLTDLAAFAGSDGVRVLSGITEGEAELRGRQDRGFKVAGAGTLRDGQFVWRQLSLGARGSYTFGSGEVFLDPLVISGAGTRLSLTGGAGRDRADLHVAGVVDGQHVGQILPRPFRVEGLLGLDGDVAVHDGAFRTSGRLSLTDLAFEIPRVIKKERGMESSAYAVVRGQRGGDLWVENLTWTLGSLKAVASGRVGRGRVSGMHLAVEVPAVEKVAALFFFDPAEARGDLSIDVRVEDVPMPVTKLPGITGYLTFRGGALHLPALEKPFQDIDLLCTFEGEGFAVDLSRLRSGGSVLTHGRLVVTGRNAPDFSLAVEMDHFDPLDFAGKYNRPFRVPVIEEGSLMAGATGTFLFRSKSVRVRSLIGSDLVLAGMFQNRTLALTMGRMATETGEVVLQGTASFAPLPLISVAGRLRQLTSREVLALLGGKADVIEGTGSITGRVSLAGRDGEELSRSASGTVTVESRKGVIRRWNILSKILALTNFYDLFRGQVDLSRDGLAYGRLSASFEGKNGLFHTDNFFIDSPAMLITGRGDLDLGAGRISGKMTVSPLVGVDKLINWIPLLRDIVHEKTSGFLFFVYDISGSLSDPEVRSSYVRSVGARVINMLRNTLGLPKEVFDEIHKEQPQR
jgi:hypothetical protein